MPSQKSFSRSTFIQVYRFEPILVLHACCTFQSLLPYPLVPSRTFPTPPAKRPLVRVAAHSPLHPLTPHPSTYSTIPSSIALVLIYNSARLLPLWQATWHTPPSLPLLLHLYYTPPPVPTQHPSPPKQSPHRTLRSSSPNPHPKHTSFPLTHNNRPRFSAFKKKQYHQAPCELGVREILSFVAFFDSIGFLFFFALEEVCWRGWVMGG